MYPLLPFLYICISISASMKRQIILFLLTLSLLSFKVPAQTGLSVTPPRVYFTVDRGQSQKQVVTVSNVSKTAALDLSVSLSDWDYDLKGNNNIYEAGKIPSSCAAWVSVLPSSFFSLAPGEQKDIEVQVSPPANLTDTLPVHTAMLYITQLNPFDDVNEKGANIKVAIRTGIKLYQRFPTTRRADLDITGFSQKQNLLTLRFSNTGNVWADGTATCELLEQKSGKKTVLKDIVFYSLPGNIREVYFDLPKDLQKGNYVASAILNYGEDTTVKLAELEFKHE